jgi:hypothetical protein
MTKTQWTTFKKMYPEAPPYMQERSCEEALDLIIMRRKAFPKTTKESF